MQICTELVKAEIPLLLSKASMKKSNTVLNFENDHASVFGKNLILSCTDSGHYYIPLTSLGCRNEVRTVLLTTRNMEEKSESKKKKLALKLHRQFSHPSYDK